MSFNLTKNEPFNLAKANNGPALSKIFLGLGWDVAKSTAKPGLMGKLFGGSPAVESVDLDSSCLMFDANKKLLDSVWFCQLKSKDGSVRHGGDNRTGAGDGDDEVIEVELDRVPANVQTLVFVINSFTGVTFEKIESAVVRVVDQTNNQEFARFNLAANGRYTAQIMAKVTRVGTGWAVTALGVPTNGRTVQDLVPAVLVLL